MQKYKKFLKRKDNNKFGNGFATVNINKPIIRLKKGG